MPWFIVKQPNGKYARFSTVVDDFTHLDMTKDEAFDVCLDDLGRIDAIEKIRKADDEEVCSTIDQRQARQPLARWRGCLAIMRALGKAGDAQERSRVGNEPAGSEGEGGGR